MDLKIVLLCLVCVTISYGSTINTARQRSMLENVMKRIRGGPEGDGGRGRSGPSIFIIGKLALRRLENVVATILENIGNVVDPEDTSATEREAEFVEQLGEVLEATEQFADLLDSIQEFVEEMRNAQDTDSESTATEGQQETTTEGNSGTTTEGDSGTTVQPTTPEQGSVDETDVPSTPAGNGTTQGPPDTTTDAKRLLNLRKTLLRALINKLENRNRK